MIVNQAALQGIYTNFKLLFNKQFEDTTTYWPSAATSIRSTGRSNDYKWLGGMPNLREWIGERQIKNLEGFGYQIFNKPFEATIGVDRDDIEDDNLGVYAPIVQGLAAEAKTHPDTLVFDLLNTGNANKCYDGQNFFSATHKIGKTTYSNYQTGTKPAWFLIDDTKPIKPLIMQMRRNPEFVALTKINDEQVFLKKKYLYGVDYRGNAGYGLWFLAYMSKADLTDVNFKAARTAMEKTKNVNGKAMGVKPSVLVVGPSSRDAAETILHSRQISASDNLLYNAAKLIVVPYLD